MERVKKMTTKKTIKLLTLKGVKIFKKSDIIACLSQYDFLSMNFVTILYTARNEYIINQRYEDVIKIIKGDYDDEKSN